MIGIRDLANHILAVAREKNIQISNLQLQKVLFFIFGRTLQFDQNLIKYDLPFEKWKYGPVVPGIYYEFNRFGGMPIIVGDEFSENEELNFLNEDIELLLNKDPYMLVEFSHRLPSWNNYADEILSGKRVPNYTIEEFRTEFIENA